MLSLMLLCFSMLVPPESNSARQRLPGGSGFFDFEAGRSRLFLNNLAKG
jgi:hypothetical protein